MDASAPNKNGLAPANWASSDVNAAFSLCVASATL